MAYELYFNNYLHLKGNQFRIYAKYGNPYKNNGLGVKWNNVLETSKLKMSLAVDLWDQDIFGKGIAGEIETNYNIFKNVDLNLIAGYKTNGFVLGKQIQSGLTLGGGITFRGNYF